MNESGSSTGLIAPDDFDNTPTNLAKPPTAATLTIRVIKSFEFRTEKSLVLHDLNLETTTCGELKDTVRQGSPVPYRVIALDAADVQIPEAVKTLPGWKPYRNVELDTLKLYTRAHGAKTTNLIINLEHDDWIFEDDSATLTSLGIENETELSFFNRKLYEEFKAHPETKWE